MKLTDEQLKAMGHNGGPALVLAVPGSGKTTMLLSRTKRLIDEGVPADEDAVLMRTVFALTESYHVMSPVHIPRGFTKAYIAGDVVEDLGDQPDSPAGGTQAHSLELDIGQGLVDRALGKPLREVDAKSPVGLAQRDELSIDMVAGQPHEQDEVAPQTRVPTELRRAQVEQPRRGRDLPPG